jgi:hypothetical protein
MVVRSCGCGAHRDDREALVDQFAKVRDGCPALRLLMLPDDTWPAFQAAIRQPPDEALHGSVLLLALDRGHLAKVTSPMHRYLLEQGQLKAGMREQYRQDLRERWLLKTSVLERHRRYRIFMGKLVELQMAEWLEAQDWTIRGLEAYRQGPDIEAEHHGEVRTVEVKYIGQEDNDFLMVVESLTSGPKAYTSDLYGPMNYLLFRVYEAAKQLQQATALRRTVAVVITAEAWNRFEFQLRGEWIEWNTPSFLTNASPLWTAFLDAQRKGYPDVEADLAPAINQLEEIWILTLAEGFELVRQYQIPCGLSPPMM